MNLKWRELKELAWGRRVIFPEAWDIYPYCVVPAGTLAIVADNDLDSESPTIMLLTNDASVTKALSGEWNGCVQFAPINDGYSWDDESPVDLTDL